MAAAVRCTPLGAGRHVGKSCLLLEVQGRRLLLDCGVHVGERERAKMLPLFDEIFALPYASTVHSSGGSSASQLLPLMRKKVDAVLVTHFHLDHCGALPFLTEVLGYDGPIFMSYATKALAFLMLEDFRKVALDEHNQPLFTLEQLRSCMGKITGVDLHSSLEVAPGLSVQAFYAGHVIGATMFAVRVHGKCILYTGDYNMSADRHLGPARVPRLEPDLLITESTYATVYRDNLCAKEEEFVRHVRRCVEGGGKVLIPLFAVGRAQELCILLHQYWEQVGLEVPMYFSGGLSARANAYYKLLLGWTKADRAVPSTLNLFDFQHVKPFDRACVDAPGACILFATPGMLHGGLSLQVFKKWAPDPSNLLVLPGYCVPGTVGYQLLQGQRSVRDRSMVIQVQMQVQQFSFSAHTDARGILQLLQQTSPRCVMLVHGEANKMELLKAQIERRLQVPTHAPANGCAVVVQPDCGVMVQLQASRNYSRAQYCKSEHPNTCSANDSKYDGGGSSRSEKDHGGNTQHQSMPLPAHLEATVFINSTNTVRLQAIEDKQSTPPSSSSAAAATDAIDESQRHVISHECSQDLNKLALPRSASKRRKCTPAASTEQQWEELLESLMREYKQMLGISMSGEIPRQQPQQQRSQEHDGPSTNPDGMLLLQVRTLRVALVRPTLQLVTRWDDQEADLALHFLSFFRSSIDR